MTTDHPELRALMTRYGVARLAYREGNTAIDIDRRAELPGRGATGKILAPTFGRLLLAHPASAERPALPRKVKAGEIVAYLAVGPVLRPVIADRDCTLRRTLQAEGTIIGHDEPLFET